MYQVNSTGGNGPFNGNTTTTTSFTVPEEVGMCEECRNKLMHEAELMTRILDSDASGDTKELADQILYGVLCALYGLEPQD